MINKRGVQLSIVVLEKNFQIYNERGSLFGTQEHCENNCYYELLDNINQSSI